MSKTVLRTADNEPIKELSAHLGTLFTLAMEKVGHDRLFRNCSKCDYWSDGSSRTNQGCHLYHVIPPVAVIVCGCDSFKDNNDIPY